MTASDKCQQQQKHVLRGYEQIGNTFEYHRQKTIASLLFRGRQIFEKTLKMNLCCRSLLLRVHLGSQVHLFNRHVINNVIIGERLIHQLKTKPAEPSKSFDFGPNSSNATQVGRLYI